MSITELVMPIYLLQSTSTNIDIGAAHRIGFWGEALPLWRAFFFGITLLSRSLHVNPRGATSKERNVR